jgi:hypothetical protein
VAVAVKSIPEGIHAITPYLTAHCIVEATAFYRKAFSEVERFRVPGPMARASCMASCKSATRFSSRALRFLLRNANRPWP